MFCKLFRFGETVIFQTIAVHWKRLRCCITSIQQQARKWAAKSAVGASFCPEKPFGSPPSYNAKQGIKIKTSSIAVHNSEPASNPSLKRDGKQEERPLEGVQQFWATNPLMLLAVSGERRRSYFPPKENNPLSKTDLVFRKNKYPTYPDWTGFSFFPRGCSTYEVVNRVKKRLNTHCSLASYLFNPRGLARSTYAWPVKSRFVMKQGVIFCNEARLWWGEIFVMKQGYGGGKFFLKKIVVGEIARMRHVLPRCLFTHVWARYYPGIYLGEQKMVSMCVNPTAYNEQLCAL